MVLSLFYVLFYKYVKQFENEVTDVKVSKRKYYKAFQRFTTQHRCAFKRCKPMLLPTIIVFYSIRLF